MIKKLLSSTLIYALAPQLPKLASLLMMPFITKEMTSLDYGVSGILMAYLASFEAFNDLGLKVILTNTFYRFPLNFQRIWKKLHGFIQLWGVFYGILLTVILYIIIPEVAMINFWTIVLLLVVPLSIFNPVCDLGRIFFQYSKKPIPVSVISAISGVITVLGNYFFIVEMNLGYLGLFAGQFFSGVFSFITYMCILYLKYDFKPDYKISIKWIRRKLNISIPTIPHYYAGFILNISDRIFLEWWAVPIEQIGIYSFAYSFGLYFSIVGKSFMQASGPYYMENLKLGSYSSEESNSKITRFGHMGLLVLAFLLSIWMKEIFDLLVRNSELASAYTLTILIIFSYTYFPTYALISTKLWYLEKTKLILRLTVSAAIVSIIFNNVLIPFLGIWGSAIATFASLMYLGYAGNMIGKIKIIVKSHLRFRLMFLSTLLFLIVAYFIVLESVFVKMLVTLLVFIYAYYRQRDERIIKVLQS